MRNKINLRILLLYISLMGVMTGLLPTIEADFIGTKSNEKFTIIVLPDTQYYSANYPWIFNNQTQWIIENMETMNIVFVTHLGDLVDNPDRIEEWDNANNSMSKLEDKVPFGVLPGNHDGAETGDGLTNYNKYFSFTRFHNQSWYGGAYQNINTNNYQLFSAGGNEYLIFHLQFNPSDDVLFWASNVINQHPTRKVIVSTHDFVHGYTYFSNSRSDIGERMWEKLVKPHADQIFLVLSGHYENEVRITDDVDGFFVHQLLSDYQDRPNGGNGWLRIIEFSPSIDEISIKTYSPYLNKFDTDSNSQFTLDEQTTERKFVIASILPFLVSSLLIILLGIYLVRRFRKKTK